LFVDNSAGRVGIGTASPNRQLTVAIPSQGGYGMNVILPGEGSITIAPDTVDNNWNPIVDAGDQVIVFSKGGVQDSGRLVITPWSSSTKGIVIRGDNGNVGIAGDPGTGNYKLYVTGNQYVSNELTVSNEINIGTTGSATDPSIMWEGDENTGIYHPAADTLSFTTAGSERVRITSGGKVGIGTASPKEFLHVYDSSGSSAIFLGGNSTGGPHGIVFDDDTSGSGVQLFYRTSPNQLILEKSSAGTGTDGTDVFSYDRDTDYFFFNGKVGIGTTEPSSNSRLKVKSGSYSFAIYAIGETTGVYGEGGGHGVYGFSDVNEGSVGVEGWGAGYDFYASGPGTNYGSSSSIRWKTNITKIPNALDKVLKIQGVYFDWDEEHGGSHDMGFIAEELGEVVPEVVQYDNPNDASNWYIDENGEKKLYATGLDYGALTPLLVEAIKEQQAEIEVLKKDISKLNALIKRLEK